MSLSGRSRVCQLAWTASLLVAMMSLAFVSGAKKNKCQGDECQLSDEHFKLYSTVKRALDNNFDVKGKDLVPWIRTTEVLRRRFAPSADKNSAYEPRLNGTKLVMELLGDERLREALRLFGSPAGRDLVNLYKSSINGNHQNLACSQWRVDDIEFAAKKLEQEPQLAKVFANIHKQFVERSARKCLKSACSSIDDNMNRLDAIQRRSSRRKGFVAREELAGRLQDELANNSLDELVAQVENEPRGEFFREELELCQFLKRTNSTQCQASGNELAELSFVKPVAVNEASVQSDWGAFFADYMQNKWSKAEGLAGDLNSTLSESQTQAREARAGDFLLGQCRAITPLLDYHLSGLRWYQKQELISGQKLRTRTFWCPSLSYWLEIERLCGELTMKLSAKEPVGSVNKPSDTFAY